MVERVDWGSGGTTIRRLHLIYRGGMRENKERMEGESSLQNTMEARTAQQLCI